MWNERWERQKGRLIGIAAGLFFGIVYLISGFWDMLIVAFILFIGYYAGKTFDSGGLAFHPDEWLKRLSERWRRFW